MRQRSLFRHLAHEHCDRAPDRLIDVNDENFVAIPDENCATATGWEYGANMYFNDRFVHCVTVPMEGRKTSCSQPHRRARPTFRTYAFSAKSGNDCFGERRNAVRLGPCLRCLAALPNTTSSASCRRLQAGSLRSPDPLATRKRPEICCWFFLNRPCMFRRINNCPLCSR